MGHASAPRAFSSEANGLSTRPEPRTAAWMLRSDGSANWPSAFFSATAASRFFGTRS